MDTEKTAIYIIGYGNRFRQDDALGAEMISILNRYPIEHTILREKFQLSFDDAFDVSESGATDVIFIDASIDGSEPFTFVPVEPEYNLSFSLTLLTPGSFLKICEEYFDKEIRGYILGIRGYEWEFSKEISSGGEINLNYAYAFLKDIISVFQNSLIFNSWIIDK